MSERDDWDLYDLEFQVEVSTRYHEWRRSTLEFLSSGIRVVVLTGAVIALIAVYAPEAPTTLVVTFAGAIIAIVSLFDLVFGVDHKARVHTDLYQRFKRLQVEIARHKDDWRARINDWRAEAQQIRVDEPPVLWAIYMKSWNQALGRRKVNPAEFRSITRLQSIMGRFYHYRPDDFPEVGVKA